MKIMAIADIESKALWDHYNLNRLEDTDLIISCGDLDSRYLSFLVTCTNVPLLYVHGNHDNHYAKLPPEGCIDIDGKIFVYFHCATEGKKIDCMVRDGRVCLEFDLFHGYVETGHSLTADYESVIAFGTVRRCTGEERIRGLKALLEHTGYPQVSAEACAAPPSISSRSGVSANFSSPSR